MTKLRKQMIGELQLRNCSEATFQPPVPRGRLAPRAMPIPAGIESDRLYGWVIHPMTKLLNELEESLKKYPPIAMGTRDPYHPPNEAK